MGLHDIADFWRDVSDKPRRGHGERFQNKINALVCVAAAGRDGAGQTGEALELGVAKRRTNRVGVRIAMADDEQFALAHVGLT